MNETQEQRERHETGPCPLCNHSLRNHTETSCNNCGKCNGATFRARRKRVRLPMPPTLELLEPLLNALGYVWSNHYVDSRDKSKAWGEVSIKTGHAGRVGMTEEEAAESVVAFAAGKLLRYAERLNQIDSEAERMKALARKDV